MIDILKYLLKRKIRRMLKHSKREKVYYNLKDIKSVLILFDTKDFEDVNAFIRILKGRKINVEMFAYKEKNDTKDYSHLYHIVTQKRIMDWKGESLRQTAGFLEGKTFDLVVDLTLKENLLLQYLLVSAKSPFKVGFYKSDLPVFDMIISGAPGLESYGFVSVRESGRQLIHYLTTISSK